MTEIPLGKLESVDPRTIWKHEAHDFTPWLLGNADRLGVALGLDLELHQAEHPVGGFSLDLLGTADGETAIVENQLGQTDHSHLGQIMTYAGGTEPRTVVWIATSFREEHRAALDWLNRNTVEDVRFFGVVVGAVRIGDSLPAPLFTVVAKPNDWGKTVKAAAAGDGIGLTYAKFWERWLEKVKGERPGWTSSTTPPKQGWMTLPAGFSEIWYGVSFGRDSLTSELYFGGPDPDANLSRFHRAESLRTTLEAAYGAPLSFEALDGKVACRIRDQRAGRVLSQDEWTIYLDWFLDTQTRLRAAVAAIGGVPALIE